MGCVRSFRIDRTVYRHGVLAAALQGPCSICNGRSKCRGGLSSPGRRSAWCGALVVLLRGRGSCPASWWACRRPRLASFRSTPCPSPARSSRWACAHQLGCARWLRFVAVSRRRPFGAILVRGKHIARGRLCLAARIGFVSSELALHARHTPEISARPDAGALSLFERAPRGAGPSPAASSPRLVPALGFVRRRPPRRRW
jgi:hypothetical protein